VLVGSGDVLVIGGDAFFTTGRVPGPYVNKFNETTNYSSTTAMSTARSQHAGEKLELGNILVAGGFDGTNRLSTAETFDPSTSTWTAAPSMAIARTQFTMTTLDTGDVLVVGGTAGGAPHSSAEVYSIGALGATCTDDSQCSSATCTDGVCCDKPCSGSCEACDVTGSIGTCSLVTGAVHGSRVSCTGAGTTCGGTCSGSSTSCQYPPATTECVAAGCTAGTAKPSVKCNGLGACSTYTTTACAPYACGAVSCKTSCLVNADCIASHYCAGGACVPRKDAGVACTDSGECTSPNVCADGVCCDTACNGACESCNLSGSAGVCSKVPDGIADPHGKCATGPCADQCRAGACAFKAATTVCAAAGCSASAIIPETKCSGTSETCTPASSMPCAGGLVCADATNCKTSCTVGTDCVTGACDTATGKCVTPSDAGPPDTEPADTGTDEGLVAETPAPDPGPTPSISGTFTRCSKKTDCPTGNCVDGVCCDSPCNERCHTCSLLTSPGKCVESPVGMDLRAECGPAHSCFGTCGPGAKCIGSGPGTMCARNQCTTPTGGIGPAYCAGAGAACPDERVAFDCAPYICEPAFGACRTVCSTSLDCMNGFACDVSTGRCQASAPPPAEDSGCAMSTTRSASPLSAGAVALLATLAFMRRRRM
jgi:hypothetical protein